MSAATPQIKSRKPTGQVPWPLILLEGGEKAGKSLVPVVLSRSDRVGMTYWVDLGEGAADEYAVLQGAQYEVIEHDGSYRDIVAQITAIYHEAKRAHEAGEPPVVLVVDSMSAEWTMLVNWTNDRARRSKNGKSKLAADPDAEIDPTSNLWNDANKRHARIMEMLMTFPGIAIVTARGKEVAVMGANGQPVEGKKQWKVEGQKALAYDASAWIRLTREPRSASLVGVRSLKLQVPRGKMLDLPMIQIGEWDVLDLEAFIFDELGCNPSGTQVRDLKRLSGDALEGLLEQVRSAAAEEALKAVWYHNQADLRPDDRETLNQAVRSRLAEMRGPSVPEPSLDEIETPDPSTDPPPAEPEPVDEAPPSDSDKLRAAAERRDAAFRVDEEPDQTPLPVDDSEPVTAGADA